MIKKSFIKLLMRTIHEKEHKIFIAFVDMIVDMLSNKRLEPQVTELLIHLFLGSILLYQKVLD